MIHIVVAMQIKPGHLDDFLAICKELRPLVLKEKGCIRYEYTQDVALSFIPAEPVDTNRVTLLETWASEADLKAHNESAHMKEYVPKLGAYREGRVLHTYKPIF